MANVITVKWGILPTYLPYSTTFLPINLLTYLLQPTYLPTYPHAYVPITYQPTHPPTYLPTTTYSPNHPPTYWLINPPTHPPINYYLPIYLAYTHPPASVPTYLPTDHLSIGLPTHPRYLLITYLPTYLTTHPPTSLPTYLPTYPPTHPPTSYNILTYVSHSLVIDVLPSHGVKPSWGSHKVKLRKVETW